MNIPRTEVQVEASRTNGALSSEPVTDHGRAASSRNSVRHGLLGNTILLPGESAEAFDLLYQGHLDEFQPQTVSDFEILRNAKGAVPRRHTTKGRSAAAARTRPVLRVFLSSMVLARWREMRIVVIHTGKQAVEILRQQQNAPDVAPHSMPFRAWTAFHHTASAGIAEPLLGRYETRFHRQYMACRRALMAAREKK